MSGADHRAGAGKLRMRRGNAPVGIDVGPTTISAAQVVGRGAGAPALLRGVVTLSREGPGPVTRDEAGKLAAALRDGGFAGSSVTLCAPAGELMVSMLELPPRTGRVPIDQVAKAEMMRIHRREGEELECAIWDVPAPERGRAGTHAMGLALSHASVKESITHLEDAGLEVVAVDARMCALARLACAQAGAGLTAIIDVDAHGAGVVVLDAQEDAGAAIVYERVVPELGWLALVEKVAKGLSISHAGAGLALRAGSDANSTAPAPTGVRKLQSEFYEQLLGEVQRSLAYAQQRYAGRPLRGCVLTGAGAHVRGLSDRLSVALGMTVPLLTPGAALDAPDGQSPEGAWNDGALACACGLSATASRVLHIAAGRAA